MALPIVHYSTTLNSEITSLIEKDLSILDDNLESSRVGLDEGPVKLIRTAKNSWVPSTHWSCGFIMHYVNLVNKDNFNYDLVGLQGETMQYTVYEEGNFYTWHNDDGIVGLYKPLADGPNVGNTEARAIDFVNSNTQLIRKLSFSLQLSDPSEYEGGQLQLLDENGKSSITPKERGTLTIFDSRVKHRVRKVTKGTRKSLVGWIVGPKWR